MKLTLKKINAEITARGIPGELVKEKDYFRMTGADWHTAYTTMILACRVNQLTMEQWLSEVQYLYNNYYTNW